MDGKTPGIGTVGVNTTAATLSTAYFDISRHTLTKNFKYISNSYTKYTSSYNSDTVDLNTSTVVDHISNNYFVFTNNFNFYDSKRSVNENKIKAHADFFPLKNQATLHEYYSENNHFNAEPGYLNRVYEKVNAGTNQQHGYDKIGLSYNIGTYDVVFKPNKLTYFTTPDAMSPYTVLNIKDSKLEKLGAVAGDNPLMSDKVFKRRENVKNNSFSNNVDPVYLCSWLSGSSTGDTRWVDRYYNPSIKNFTDALSTTSYYKVITAAGAETTETFDFSSSLTKTIEGKTGTSTFFFLSLHNRISFLTGQYASIPSDNSLSSTFFSNLGLVCITNQFISSLFYIVLYHLLALYYLL